MSFRLQWGLPLFAKELLEQAARRRTYLIRIGFVLFLLCMAMSSLETQLRGRTALDALGQGTKILGALIGCEFQGIYLFLPAMACGVLTIEKERNTLPLLFLTRLGPWTIIFEKLLSRLLPMLMFVCCALPLMAFTYSMGGLTLLQLFGAAYFLLISLFQVASISVMCSAYAHSTVAALVQTYVVIIFFSILPGMVLVFLPNYFSTWLTDTFVVWVDFLSRAGYRGQFAAYQAGINPYVVWVLLSPPSLYEQLLNSRFGITIPPGHYLVLLGMPSIMSGFACLGIARWALYRRANVVASNPLLKLFRGMDGIFFWLNRKVKFDVKLVQESSQLPDFEPIAWREVSKRSLGQFRYLVRIMVPLLFPVIFVGIMMAQMTATDYSSQAQRGALTPLVFFLGLVDLVLIAIVAANVIPLERTRQTWDVLRSLPMSSRQILVQKLRGVRRLQWVCSIPLFATVFLNAWWRYQLALNFAAAAPGAMWGGATLKSLEYLLGALLSVVLYTELVKWISLWCGMVFKSSMRAILFSIPCVILATVLPSVVLFLAVHSCCYLVLLVLPYFPLEQVWTVSSLAWMTSPYVFTVFNEWMDFHRFSSIILLPALIHTLSQLGLLSVIRGHILKHADWYLGRIGPSPRQTAKLVVAANSPLDHIEDAIQEEPQVAEAAR